MPVRIVILLVFGLSVLPAVSAAAAAEVNARVCLNKNQQHAAVASGRAIPLARARAALKGRSRRDVIGARLCESPNGLVYLLTLLPRSGKVSRVAIDAATGVIIRGH
jgi:uncharacterized membrane protein YkoI